MKSFRRLLLFAVSVAGLFLITGLVLSFTYEDAVIRYLKKYLDRHLTTEIEVSQIKFSFIRKFPSATIELRNIIIYSGTGFNNKEFSGMNTDTLLSAKSIFFEFGLLGVLKNEYKLKNIRIVDGRFLLLSDARQKVNYKIWEGTQAEDQEEFTLTLQNIILSNTRIKYTDLLNKIKIDADSKKLFIRADLKRTENLYSFNGYLDFHQISVGQASVINEKKLGVDIKMRVHEKHYTFFQSSIHSGKLALNFSGDVDNANHILVNLNFQSGNASIREIENLFPSRLLEIKKNFALTGGSVDLNGTIKGVISKQVNPKIDLSFHVRNAAVTNQLNRKKISDIFMDGDFTNGSGRNRNTAVLSIKKWSANQGKSQFDGAIKVKGLNVSDVEIILQSAIQADDFVAFLNVDTFEQISGKIATDVYLKGHLPSLKKIDPREILSLKKEGFISFNDVTFQLKNSGTVFRKLTGDMILEDIIKLRDLSFSISDNDFNLNCNLVNLPRYLFNKEFLAVDAQVRSEYLDIKSLLDVTGSDTNRGSSVFPERILVRSDFSISKLVYGKFTADSVEGFVSYDPKVFNFETFQLHSLDGFISGNATFSQTADRGISITCTAELGKIEIQKLFYATNNFGQDVILDKNLEGELSGILNFTSEWDSRFRLIDSSIIASSDIEIINGQLIDYEPMLGLSRFVNVEELKDIKFRTLRNQVIIKNRKVIIPEMDIHSSAFNMKGSGIHHFNNHYDYRLQVELNELLSNKARKRRREIEEFGVVEDDGLGKLNVPIKIIGRGSDYDVNFDRKRAVSTFRNNITSEKEEIKNLFKNNNLDVNIEKPPDDQNKEFIIDWDGGNEKKDFIFEEKDQKEKEQPRFIIEWEEDDDTTAL